MGNREDHHETLSGLGFYFQPDDLPIINAYHGKWVVTDTEHQPNNYWVVTTDGKGHSVTGHRSPQQILDWADEQGWLPAYVAPYGKYVEGEMDAIQLHDWISQGRRDAKQHRLQ